MPHKVNDESSVEEHDWQPSKKIAKYTVDETDSSVLRTPKRGRPPKEQALEHEVKR
ncbi:hypothetical protein KIN20_028883, partial [Parelaphostrongylus tenuis]